MKNERRSQIKAYISEHKSARIEDLAKQNPDVSLMTLRRDLAALEEEGFAVDYMEVMDYGVPNYYAPPRQRTFTAGARSPT